MPPAFALAAATALAVLTTAVSPGSANAWGWPATGPLGDRPAIERRFDPPAQRWDAGHRGIDLDVLPGAEVLAVADGVVAFSGQVGGKPVVSIDHPGGIRSTYEPVTAEVVVGDAVRRGARIGTVAAEGGHCAGSCLHLGARRGEQYVNPMALLARVVLKPLR